MIMSAEHRSKFLALHRQWWRLHMSKKFSSGTKNPKQTNKKQCFTKISKISEAFRFNCYMYERMIVAFS